MPVNSQKKEYGDELPKWALVRACNEGSQTIKRGGTRYLPQPNPDDKSKDNSDRYKAYVERANFVNFTGHTKEGLVGVVFRKDSTIELAPEIDYMLDNMNGGGLSANQMAKDAVSEVMMTGRDALLTDYPPAPEGLTDAQVTALELKANILPYPAESVINWRTTVIGGVKKLSMVVLQEPTEKISSDGFETESVMYHRVLLLKPRDILDADTGEAIDIGHIYVQNLYDENGDLFVWGSGEFDTDGDEIMTGDIFPRKFNGSLWNEIPFIFIGSINNDETIDKGPLYDIAEVNVAHYRNSADFEESSFIVGQPTPAIAGLTQTWVNDNFEDGIQLGSRGGIMLPEGGSASLLQAAPNQMPERGMEMKEIQAVKIGARIIEDTSGTETVDAARMRFAGQNSKLGTIVTNVEHAFKKSFAWAMEFMGGSQEPEVDINKEFYEARLDPQMVVAQIQLLDRGVIAQDDLRDNLRKAGQIRPDRTDEEIEGEAESVEIL